MAATVTHWAVILGVNYYRGGEHECLHGSVQDALTARDWVEKHCQTARISILTATSPVDLSVGRPIENKESWPTYDNLEHALKRILEHAKSGDFVNFHYSGHGTRIARPGKSTLASRDELALVLFEDNSHGCKYVRGSTLAKAFKKMVGMNLELTVVMDCCFSGAVTRGEQGQTLGVRSLPYSHEVDDASPQYFLQEDSEPETERDATKAQDWLIDPKGYSILAACSPHENAYEVRIAGGERRGALTYLLHLALYKLRVTRTTISNHALHHYLSAKMHAQWPQQNPMRYGNTQLSFFGSLLDYNPDQSLIQIYNDGGECLRLGAGHIHGIFPGDELSVFPPLTASDAASNRHEAYTRRVRVKTVRSSESDVVEICRQPVGVQQSIDTAWGAKLVTSLAPRQIRVRVDRGILEMKPWSESSDRTSRFLEVTTEHRGCEDYLFSLDIDRERNQLKIVSFAAEGNNNVVSAISASHNGALDLATDILQHLATFKYLESIENRVHNPSFMAAFTIDTKTSPDQGGRYCVQHGQEWSLNVQNNSQKMLYLVGLDFQPNWDIINLDYESHFTEIPPGKEEDVELRMKVPKECLGQGQCTDIIKVFIMSKPTRFPNLNLPRLPEDEGQIGDRPRAVTSELDLFLVDLSSQSQFRGGDSSTEHWACFNYIIDTRIEEDGTGVQ